MSKEILDTHGFDKPFRVEDRATETVRDQITFPCHKGMEGKLELPVSEIADSRALQKKLLDADAVLPRGEERKALLAALADYVPEKRQTLLSHCGWVGDYQAFVIGKRVIGDAGESALSPWVGEHKWGRCPMNVSGSLEEWQESVAKRAGYSSILLTLLSTSFGAPLLKPLNLPGFIIFVFGPTRKGKTVATTTAGSSVGIGREEDLPKWSMTDNRLGETLPGFNDTLYLLDDLMSMKGTDKERVERVDNLAYLVGSGRERDRYSTFQGSGGPGEWRSIVITQNEYSLQELSSNAAHVRPGGAMLRAFDLPALEPGENDIFDLWAEQKGRRMNARLRVKVFASLISACQANSGFAFDEYMGELIKDPHASFAFGKAASEEFVRRVSKAVDGDEPRDLARRFSVIYAGAALAIKLGTVPWTREMAMEAISRCYVRARNMLRDDGLVLQHGLDHLADVCAELPRYSANRDNEFDWNSVAGYRMRRKGSNIFVMRKVAFNGLFSSVRQRELVLNWLMDRGAIETAMPKNVVGLPSPQDQFVWPDDKRVRSYRFSIPEA